MEAVSRVWRFKIGDWVRMEGIGRGPVVACDVYQGRNFYLVDLPGGPTAHLCAEWELLNAQASLHERHERAQLRARHPSVRP